MGQTVSVLPSFSVTFSAWGQLIFDRPLWQTQVTRDAGKSEVACTAPFPRFTKIAPPSVLHVCVDCGKVCKSAQGVAAHRRAAHGWVDPIWAHLVSDVCPVCNKSYHSRVRLAMHLRESKCRKACLKL